MVNYLEINVDSFSRNIQQVKKIVGSHIPIMAVLKADAYGHGAVKLAKKALENGVSAIAVGTPEEAFTLRENGISSTIIALDSITDGYEEELLRKEISSVVSSWKAIEAFEKISSKTGVHAKVHIKVDTGMGRLGVKPEIASAFFEKIEKKKELFIEGLMTHFALSYDKTNPYTNDQINLFTSVVTTLSKKGYRIPHIHAANSGAIIHYPDSYFTMVRPGIILYGSLPFENSTLNGMFEPVMQFKSQIVHVSTIKKGESISYNRDFIAEKDMTIAVVPVGYAAGYSRVLSNKSEMIVKGKRVRQVGIICMDLSVIDITSVQGVKQGEEVVLIGTQGNQTITVEEIAKKANTIPYEVLCMIGNRVKRVYI